MKIVVINGNPKMDKGNISVIINPFLEGMKEAGAEVTLFYTEKSKIKPCRGCKKCLYKTPGECFQRDDVKVVLSELSQAEVWVFAAPLRFNGLSAPLKKLVGRMLPLTTCEGAKAGKLVLVSSCDNWELKKFDPLVQHTTDPAPPQGSRSKYGYVSRWQKANLVEKKSQAKEERT